MNVHSILVDRYRIVLELRADNGWKNSFNYSLYYYLGQK